MTRTFYFHPNAVEQQTRIWHYTNKNWGATQADRYIDGLHEKLALIAEEPVLLRNLPNKFPHTLKFFHHEHHFIFVRLGSKTEPDTLQILSILHDTMDLPLQLNKILKLL